MKIRGNNGISQTPFGPAPAAGPAEKEPAEGPKRPGQDQIEISSQVQQLKAAVSQLPEVRTEKIEGIRGAVEEGTYHVESEKLAKAVVDEALEDALRREGRLSARTS